MPVQTPVRRRLATVAVLLVGLGAPLTGTGLADRHPASGAGTAEAEQVVFDADALRMRAGAPIVITGPRGAGVGTRVLIQGDVVTRAVVRNKRTGERRATSQPRRVRLLERVDGTWQLVGRTRTKRSGTFLFRFDAGPTEAVRSFRAEAPRARGLKRVRTRVLAIGVKAAAVEDPAAVAGTWETLAPGSLVTPEALPAGYAAAGSSTDWAYLFSEGGRWNPCAPIRWAYNPAQQEYVGAFADVVRAFARISAVSGLQFQYVGSTTVGYLGQPSDLDALGTTADVVVSWATAAQYPSLAGDVVGIGGGVAKTAKAPTDVKWRFFRGYLVLDADNGFAIPSGFDVSGWGQVMQHEILHALGLGHAAGGEQLMYGAATPKNIRFGAGDLTGMAKIGATSGCLS
jgi:hypothetical protein